MFLSISIRNKTPLKNLHDTLLPVINQFRAHAIRYKDMQRIKQGIYTPEETQHIKKHGYLRTAEFYKPHITLGKLTDTNNIKVESIQKKLNQLTNTPIHVSEYTIGLYQYNYTTQTFKTMAEEKIKLS